jgi:sterol 24-C-methyltransferase
MNEDNSESVIWYYNRKGSRIGYDLFLGGTKHFGLYRDGDSAWNWPAALRRMEDKLGSVLSLPQGAHVLDAGCGVGHVADHLAAEYGLRVSGIDILDFNIRSAKEQAARRGLQDQVDFSLMSYADLKFRDETFDGVYTMETLVHAADAEVVLREFHRVLKKDGRLVMFEYSHAPERAMPKYAHDTFREVNALGAMPSFQRFEHGVLEQLIEKVGFSGISVEDITSQMMPMFRCFERVGRFPYWLARQLHREEKMVNAMSAVEFWRYRDYFRYNVYSATKRT